MAFIGCWPGWPTMEWTDVKIEETKKPLLIHYFHRIIQKIKYLVYPVFSGKEYDKAEAGI